MKEKALLLGHGREYGLALARILVESGLAPVAARWQGFSPRAYGRDRPVLILADVDGPGAPDWESFCQDVRRRWGRTFPILAVSASNRFGRVAALLDAGADDCIAKSAPPALAAKKISRVLFRRSSASGDLLDDLPASLLELFSGNGDLVRLEELARVHAGATPRKTAFRRMAPPDQDWRGVMTSDVVDRFYAGRPTQYLRWSRLHLFRLPDPAEYAVAEKVLLRRAGPPLRAAVDRSRLPAGTDVYALVPRDGVSAGYLACLFNSRLLDFYFNRVAEANADGRLRLETLRLTPVPVPGPEVMQEFARTAALLAHYGPSPESWIDRQSREELRAQMDERVFELYGADCAARGELAALHF